MSTPSTPRPDYISLVEQIRGAEQDAAEDRARVRLLKERMERNANAIRAQRIREQLCTMCHDLGYQCGECAMNRAEYYR